jgi:hypothetical protein
VMLSLPRPSRRSLKIWGGEGRMVAKIQVSKAIFNFDNALYLLIVKYLKNVPREEIERVYGERITQLFQNILDTDKKYPEPTQVLRHPYICWTAKLSNPFLYVALKSCNS